MSSDAEAALSVLSGTGRGMKARHVANRLRWFRDGDPPRSKRVNARRAEVALEELVRMGLAAERSSADGTKYRVPSARVKR